MLCKYTKTFLYEIFHLKTVLVFAFIEQVKEFIHKKITRCFRGMEFRKKLQSILIVLLKKIWRQIFLVQM